MSSDAPLPLTSADLERAAEELIADHGDAALEQAEKRVRALRSEGFESMARIWERDSATLQGLIILGMLVAVAVIGSLSLMIYGALRAFGII